MPTGLQGNALARVRANAIALLLDTCTIQDVTTVSDGSGGKQKSWTAGTVTACRVGNAKTIQRDSSLGVQETVTVYPLELPYNATITATSRVLHGGHTYEIWALNDDSSPLVLKEAQLVRVG